MIFPYMRYMIQVWLQMYLWRWVSRQNAWVGICWMSYTVGDLFVWVWYVPLFSTWSGFQTDENILLQRQYNDTIPKWQRWMRFSGVRSLWILLSGAPRCPKVVASVEPNMKTVVSRTPGAAAAGLCPPHSPSSATLTFNHVDAKPREQRDHRVT